MKKGLKIAGMTLASLVIMIVIAVVILFWVVLTPERITPLVQKQAEKYISCRTTLGEVDITLAKTFPQIGICITNLQLLNPMPDAPSDTLLSVEECVVAIDIKELLQNKAVVIRQFHLKNGLVNLFTSPTGTHNYDVLMLDTTEEDSSAFTIDRIDLHKIRLENTHLFYTNRQAQLQTEIKALDLVAEGEMKGKDIVGNVELTSNAILFSLQDSIPLNVSANDIHAKVEGSLNDFNTIAGDIELSMEKTNLSVHDIHYLQSAQIALNAPLNLLLDSQALTLHLHKATIAVNENQIQIDGTISNDKQQHDIKMNLAFETNRWDISTTLALVPASFKTALDGITIGGGLTLSGKLSGIYNDTHMPVLVAAVKYEQGKFAQRELPYMFRDINASVDACIDMNTTSKLTLHHLRAKTGNNVLQCKGTVDDLLNTMLCNLQMDAHLDLSELQPMMPAQLKAKGLADASLRAKFTLAQIINLRLEEIKTSGTVNVSGLDVNYNDSIKLKSTLAQIDFELPSPSVKQTFKELAYVKINSEDMATDVVDLLSASMHNLNLNIGISDFRDTTKLLSVVCDFNINKLYAEMDTLSATISKPFGSVTLRPSEQNPRNHFIACTYSNENLLVNSGKHNSFTTKNISLEGNAVYDDQQEDMLLQWNPNLRIYLQQGVLNLTSLPTVVSIPVIRFNFTPGKFNIRESRILIGNSDFRLSGIITHIDDYIKKTGLLKGELTFVSEHADVSQLMGYVNGMGSSTDSAALAAENAEMEKKDDNPFIVPLGIDISLNTQVKRALVGETLLQDLHGLLTIKDGILVLEEMGFTSEAARMQLTAIYRSPRKNHLFAGIDFHLLDIDIARLVAMFPDIDTLVPMLKSFAGKAEFHFAIETYLKSNYELKMSTLRGATAISGQDLVLMDNETFSEIAKKLRFSKKAQNKVDSLSVEITLFKNEIDVYPFLIALDKYKAVVSGRHNLDMSFDYHISVTDSPIPVRLGLHISGTIDNLKYKLAPCEYPHLYRPDRQKAVEKKAMELKEIISGSLKANVKQ